MSLWEFLFFKKLRTFNLTSHCQNDIHASPHCSLHMYETRHETGSTGQFSINFYEACKNKQGTYKPTLQRIRRNSRRQSQKIIGSSATSRHTHGHVGSIQWGRKEGEEALVPLSIPLTFPATSIASHSYYALHAEVII